jgi:hypothetical protein
LDISINFDEATLAQLDAVAATEGCSRGDVLTDSFLRFLQSRHESVANNGWPQLLIDHWDRTKPDDYADVPDFDDASDTSRNFQQLG